MNNRTCPRCKQAHVIPDGYCGVCRECTLEPLSVERGTDSQQREVSQRRETCQWTEDENGPHETECGHAFEFTYDGVEANGFKYCCFCGGSIITKLANAGGER